MMTKKILIACDIGEAFKDKLDQYDIDTTVLDFKTHEWVDFDYGKIDFIIYYPSFEYSSSHPLALNNVYDNLMFIHSEYPNIKIYPDPSIIKYYNFIEAAILK